MELWLVLGIIVCVLALGLIAYLWHRGTIMLNKEKAEAMKDSVIADVKDWRDHLGHK